MFRKKGQAALEFLTTYGWAFLVILVMIGALSYFGVLDPSRYAPDACKLSGTLECTGSYAVTHIAAGSTVALNILNNNAETVTITKAIVSEKAAGVRYTSDAITETINAYGSDDVTFTMADGGLTSDMLGKKKVFNIDIYYTLPGSNIENVIQGTITTTVQ